jgi:hypothetical protein
MEEVKKRCAILKGLIEEHIRHFPWLTRNMLNHYIITYTNDNIMPLEIVTGTNNYTVVSGLTGASPIDMATVNSTVITAPTGTTTTQESESVSTSKRGRRPTGSTKIAIDGRKSLVLYAVDKFVIQIASIKAMALHKTHKLVSGKKCYVRWGTFK